MKNFTIAALVLSMSVVPAAAAEKDIEQIPACQYCGMDRQQFSKTRMYIEYEGGSKIGTCSIHDAAVDLAQSIGKTVETIWVSDYGTEKLIDAEKASWVIGTDLPGVMSGKSRLAFESSDAAAAFQKEHGGTLVSWDEAIDDTYGEMWNDIKMIREKRAKMKKMKGMK